MGADRFFADKVELRIFFQRLGHIQYIESAEYPTASLLADIGGHYWALLSRRGFYIDLCYRN